MTDKVQPYVPGAGGNVQVVTQVINKDNPDMKDVI
jgi:hypothetical protein